MRSRLSSRIPVAGLAAGAVALLVAAAAPAEPLRVAADVGYAPWAMQSPGGDVEGFAVDAAREISRRIGRDGVEVIDVNFSAIFAGLFAARYDLIVAPMAITVTRTEQLLFTEGYMTGGLALVVLAENTAFSGPEDLRGKVLATNSGSLSDTWATENEATYGYSVQRYDKDTDAMQAVVTGRADANVVNLNVAQYAAKRDTRLRVGYRIYADYDLGYAVRKDDLPLREAVENAVECMKLDGTFQRLHEQWFGEAPESASSMMKVFVGLGPAGLEGYDPTPRVPVCG